MTKILKNFRTAFPLNVPISQNGVDLDDHVNMKIGGLMCKQQNVQGRAFDFRVLGLFTGKAPCLGARGGPENKYQWLTFEEVCPNPNLFYFFLRERGVRQSFCFILVYQYINLIVQNGKSREV